MDCCYSGCDGYEVAPMLEPPCCECCDDEPVSYPRLPVCNPHCCKKPPKPMYCHESKPPKVMYCCESKPPKLMYCCEKKPPKVVYKTKPCCNDCHRPPSPCHKTSCCHDSEPCCKPVKTKYIIPCYRYEDGRIVS